MTKALLGVFRLLAVPALSPQSKLEQGRGAPKEPSLLHTLHCSSCEQELLLESFYLLLLQNLSSIIS